MIPSTKRDDGKINTADPENGKAISRQMIAAMTPDSGRAHQKDQPKWTCKIAAP